MVKVGTLIWANDDMKGIVKLGIGNQTVEALRFPKTQLKEATDRKEGELKKTGIYFLFGKDEDNRTVVYVGKAAQRSNGEPLVTRLREHLRNEDKDFWKDTIVISTINDRWNDTEAAYLESSFTERAKAKEQMASDFVVINGNVPTKPNVLEADQILLEETVDNILVMLEIFGYNLDKPKAVQATQNTSVKTMSYNGAHAQGLDDANGFIVLRGSQIVTSPSTKSCNKTVKTLREEFLSKYSDGILREDMLFNSASQAAGFVGGASLSGNQLWK